MEQQTLKEVHLPHVLRVTQGGIERFYRLKRIEHVENIVHVWGETHSGITKLFTLLEEGMRTLLDKRAYIDDKLSISYKLV